MPTRTRLVVLPLEDRLTPATGGAFDPAFATRGVATVGLLQSAKNSAVDIAPAADGSTYVLGGVFQNQGGLYDSSLDVGLVKLTPAGAVDTSFGVNGRATLGFDPPGGPAAADVPVRLAVRPDGRIAAAVAVMDPATGTAARGVVAVFTPAGRLDTAFNGTGTYPFLFQGQPFNATGYYPQVAAALVAQADNGLLLAGSVKRGDGVYLTTLRLTADGRPDPGYGTVGEGSVLALAATPTQYQDVTVAPAVLADGSVVAAVASDNSVKVGRPIAGVKLTAGGQPDTAFGRADFGTTGVSRFPRLMTRAAVGGGVYLVSTESAAAGGESDQARVSRYTAAGAVDGGFGTAGTTLLDGSRPQIGSNTAVRALDAAVVAGNRLVLVGGFGPMGMVRLTAAGSPDPAFNGDGFAPRSYSFAGATYNPDYPDYPSLVRPTADGTRLLVGREPFNSPTDAQVSRVYTADGSDVPAFDVSPVVPVLAPADPYGPRPNSSQNQAFVKGLYRTILGRDADEGGVNSWTAAMANGATPLAVTQGFWNSPENRARQVDGYYLYFLGRGPDAQGRQSWMNILLNGVLDEAGVAQQFLQSPEAIARGGTTGGYVDLVYQAVLNRLADAPSRADWVQRLDTGAITRDQFVRGLVRSAESYNRILTSFYRAYLKRVPSSAELANWRAVLAPGTVALGDVAVGFVGSQEFYANAAGAVG